MIEIDGKLINVQNIHFIRRESSCSLLVSFGSDFLRFLGSSEYVDEVYEKLYTVSHEQFSSKSRR